MQLKELYFLTEEAVSAEKAMSNKVAALIDRDEEQFYVILYNSNILADEQYLQNPQPPEKYILAWGLIETDADMQPYNSAMVGTTAAVKGYGPLLYDIALSIARNEYRTGIHPDRSSVSPAARNVWSYYLKNRPDVYGKPIDDVNQPETPKEIDDSYVHEPGHISDRDSVDYVYFIKTPVDYKSLEQAHQQNLKQVNIDLEELLLNGAQNMYRSMIEP